MNSSIRFASYRNSRLLLLAFVCLFSVQVVSGQAIDSSYTPGTLIGTVTDSETRLPIKGASVFLNNTMRGASTDTEGRYLIAVSSPGSYELVVSHVGYAPTSRTVQILPGSEQTIDFSIAPTVYQIDSLEVTAVRPLKWRAQLEKFNRLFLGTTDNAEKTYIRNPYVLDFVEDKQTFSASASEPLEIDNLALGYHLKFILDQFVYFKNRDRIVLEGRSFFSEMPETDTGRLKDFTDHREETYRGSMRHFLWALIHKKTVEEGFRMSFQTDIQMRALPEMVIPSETLVRRTERSYEYDLAFKDYLLVTSLHGKRKQISWLHLEYPNATVHEIGYVYAPTPLVATGYMGGQRVGDLLPYEFVPERQKQLIREELARAAEAVEPDGPSVGQPGVTPEATRFGLPLLSDAVQEMERRDWDKAERLLSRIIKEEPENIEARYRHGITCREINRLKTLLDPVLPSRLLNIEGTWSDRARADFEAVVRKDSTYKDVLAQWALFESYEGHHMDAIRLGERQIRLKPDLASGHTLLVRVYNRYISRTKGYTGLDWLKAYHTGYSRWAAGEILRRKQDFEGALREFRAILSDHEGIPLQPVLLSLARIHYALNEPDTAQYFVDTAINLIDSPAGAALVFDDFKYVLSEEELWQYQSIDLPAGYKSFFTLLWERRNPMPSKGINERLREHFNRMRIAEMYYAGDDVRVWANRPDRESLLEYPDTYWINDSFTDQGLIFIRHGYPDEIVKNAGAGTGAESWHYMDPRMDFHFATTGVSSVSNQDDGTGLSGLSGVRLGLVALPARVLLTDSKNSDGYWSTTMGINKDERMSEMLMWDPVYRGLVTLPGQYSETVEQKSRDFVWQGLRTDRYTLPAGVRSLSIPALAASFKGTGNKTRWSLFYSVPIGQMAGDSQKKDGIVPVETGFVIYDKEWRKVASDLLTQSIPWNGKKESEAVRFFTADIPPGEYHVSFHLLSKDGTKAAMYKGDLMIPPYDGQQLTISEILPATSITEGESLHLFEVDGPQVDVAPGSRFNRKNPLYLYYEVYNLIFGADDRAKYVITYNLTPIKEGFVENLLQGQEAAILTLESSGTSDSTTLYEQASIDVSRVATGRYLLNVIITDETSGSRAARSIPIELVK